jgi:hypothetical protein
MANTDRSGNTTKPAVAKPFSAFTMGRNGSMVVDREKLHESDGYKRQIAALAELKRMESKR